jgi:phosphopantetheinyl transferase (holo-ACP synthase)
MIVAVGIDMIELSRVRAVLERHPERFLTAALREQRLEAHLSLTHSREHAAAFVVLERRDTAPRG